MTLSITTLCIECHYAECSVYLLLFRVSFVECPYAECRYAECRYADCHYAECRYAEWPYAECPYADCHYTECTYAECPYAECPYAKCSYAECPYGKCSYAECPYCFFNFIDKQCKLLKVPLHYHKNCAKLVRFKQQKKYFALLKHSNLAQFLP